MKIINPTIGADIEVFFFNKKENHFISAEGYIQGTKDVPYIFDTENPMFAVSLDNVLAEFCIPPVTDAKSWLQNIKKSFDYVNSLAPENCIAVAHPAANLNPSYLQTPNARRFGCEPDVDVWALCYNEPPRSKDRTLRSAGGHIHIGWDEPTNEIREAMIKAMDLYVGIPSVLQEPNNKRKELYGKAGAFRPKVYGVEYRTVSNYYLQSDNLLGWIYEATNNAIDFVNNNDIDYLDTYKDQIQDAINNNNVVSAQNLINHFNLLMA
jgi:hypothetical protein